MVNPNINDPALRDRLEEVHQQWDVVKTMTPRRVAGIAIDRTYSSGEDNPRDVFQEDK